MEDKTQMLNVLQPENANRFNKQLGNVIYDVGVNFKEGATETLDKKIIRIIKNELERYDD